MTAAQVRDTGFELVDPSLHKAPLAAVIMVNSPNGDGSIYEVRQYFTEVEIGEITTLDDVIQSGGYMLTQRIAAGQDAELVMRESNRAVEVTVASYAGALIWGDPHREGARRAFGLYWSDGKYDLSIRAGLEDPADVVEIARSIYCST